MIGEEKHELSVKLVDKLLVDAFTDKASNIHLEPLRDPATGAHPKGWCLHEGSKEGQAHAQPMRDRGTDGAIRV